MNLGPATSSDVLQLRDHIAGLAAEMNAARVRHVQLRQQWQRANRRLVELTKNERREKLLAFLRAHPGKAFAVKDPAFAAQYIALAGVSSLNPRRDDLNALVTQGHVHRLPMRGQPGWLYMAVTSP